MKNDFDMSKDRRAQLAALMGLVLQVAMFAVLLIVGSIYESSSIRAEAIHLHLGIYIWLALILLYSQRRSAGVEQLETEELKRRRETVQDTGIFDLEDDAMLVQRRRLNWMYRWFVPAAALLLALGHIIWAGWWYVAAMPVRDERWASCIDPQRALPFVVGATFFCFLYSRYASGMARRSEWRLLRAASSYMAGNAFLCLTAVVGLALVIYEVPYAEAVVTYVIRLGMLILGVEFFLNFVLDFYRPRMAGAEHRPAFDSRLLGLISEPGGIARSIQEAINYQFGFEVSGTWFYQLLKRSLLPLALFALLVLIGLSSVVIVDADEQIFVERFGQVLQPAGAPLGPGLQWKCPWPVDSVQRERVLQLQRMTVGEAAKQRDEESDLKEQEAILWTGKHDYIPELMLLVASPKPKGQAEEESPGAVQPATANADDAEGRAVAVSLIMASVDLECRISDLYKYSYNYVDPDAVMENVAYQVLADHAASIDVSSFMGPRREEISKELRVLLQRKFDELNLGVELTFVGLQSAHPPSKDNVAKVFQDVIAAKSRKEATIQTAIGIAERMLTRVAGSKQRALELNDVLLDMERLSKGPQVDSQALAEVESRVNELMFGCLEKGVSPMSGEAAAKIADMRAETSKRISEAESKERTFKNELLAYQAAPQLYQMRRYLEVLRGSLHQVRKIINSTRNTELVVIVETERKSEFELPKPEKKQ
ncbi:MAG: hypothetical protein KAV82_12185 [Phycisphaerae bacterium]|nr:hypothetical protein [Phycisphaerae bacterium]